MIESDPTRPSTMQPHGSIAIVLLFDECVTVCQGFRLAVDAPCVLPDPLRGPDAYPAAL
jgi:hypothetical protein